MVAATPESSGQSRKVLDEARINESTFDEEVLSELGDNLREPYSSGDKVELDKADLPLAFEEEVEPEPEPEPEPELEVDLADEPGMPPMEGQEEEPKSKVRRYAFLGVLASIAIGLSLGLWYGLLKPKERVKTELPPYFFQGPIPDPDKILRVDLKPFIVPLLASDEGRILRITISLESPDDEAKLLLSDKTRLLRDVIYRILRDRPAGEIMTYRGKKLLQAQIKTEINHILNQRLVYQVLFTEFVVTG
jgi:flagellar basal body-associated protein FliL